MHQDPSSRLLAVDDNRDSAELIVRAAERCGYEARYLLDPGALGDALAWSPQVITLDLGMPEVDGIQVLVQLADRGFAGDLIIISGHSRSERERAMQIATTRGLRVTDHFSKPVPLHGLRSALVAIKTIRAQAAPAQKRSFFRLPRKQHTG